ncbi:thioesterase family protein [Helicovermis profundi]|uniref:Fluoroacetyl-CoA-specific thioesterase-like domain-containing protein n=1 Tax=Helicovermis profundi TaxID=3065157 RepID=A0AAU9EA16_9FIRM|nr:hypothetical protein HLPR_04450 [Clostridia bacterium S502]
MLNLNGIKVGESFTIQKKVTEEDTALNYGSGKLEKLFATPSLIALMIEGSSMMLDDKLEEGYITVGKSISASHDKPTVLGETVSVKIVVDEIVGTKIKLKIDAFDEIGLIGHGEHERVVVNKNSLLQRANKREEKLKSTNY